ncbi:hypothetical protein FOA52_016166 [Chlamydomonas sp. UWO 241]|nr:hypothetical protein FOA52_016166 [Chlamydomonas sp. UWO 241]
MAPPDASDGPSTSGGIQYRAYRDEVDLPVVMALIDADLSEPYTIYTYRYFLHSWPKLCYLAYDGDRAFGVVISKMDMHKDRMRGYVAMLVVDKAYRGKGAGSELAKMAIQEMIRDGCDEVVLEAEVVNTGALKLYQALGFVRDKRLHRYYLNGMDAYRLRLVVPREGAQHKAGEGLMQLGGGGDVSLDAVATTEMQPMAV